MPIIGLKNEGTTDLELDLTNLALYCDDLVDMFAFYYGCHILFSVNVGHIITGKEKIMD